MTYSNTDRSAGGHAWEAPVKGVHTSDASIWLAGVLAFVLLIGAGVAYRVAASGLQRIRDNPVVLPMPLSTIPMRIDRVDGQGNGPSVDDRRVHEGQFCG